MSNYSLRSDGSNLLSVKWSKKTYIFFYLKVSLVVVVFDKT